MNSPKEYVPTVRQDRVCAQTETPQMELPKKFNEIKKRADILLTHIAVLKCRIDPIVTNLVGASGDSAADRKVTSPYGDNGFCDHMNAVIERIDENIEDINRNLDRL